VGGVRWISSQLLATLEETGCLADGGGRFKVRTFNDAGAATDAAFSFVVDARPMP
jgi:hypothetical protein